MNILTLAQTEEMYVAWPHSRSNYTLEKYMFLNRTSVLTASTYRMNAITPTPQMSAATPTFSPLAFSGAEIWIKTEIMYVPMHFPSEWVISIDPGRTHPWIQEYRPWESSRPRRLWFSWRVRSRSVWHRNDVATPWWRYQAAGWGEPDLCGAGTAGHPVSEIHKINILNCDIFSFTILFSKEKRIFV